MPDWYVDVYVSRISQDGLATVKGFYRHFEGSGVVSAWGRGIWKHFILPSRSFACWRFLHGRLPVDEIISHQGVQLVSRCYLCEQHVKSLVHLFEDFFYARFLWNAFAALFDLGVLPRYPLNLFQHARKLRLSSQIYALRLVGFLEVVWIIWGVQNHARHEGSVRPLNMAVRGLCYAIGDSSIHRVGSIHNTMGDLLILKRLGIEGNRGDPNI